MKTAIYLRKSRHDNDGLSVDETLRRHSETLFEYAAAHPEIEIVKVYKEVVSGESLYARPEMLKMLEAAANNEFSAILCIDMQRLGRGSETEQGIIHDTLKYNKIKIITVRKIFDLNNEMDEDQAEFEGLFSRMELRRIKRRLNDGTLRAVREGCFLNEPPFGYTRKWIDKKATLEIKEDEARFVRMIFEMYANGVGAQTIAYTVNGLGAKPHRSDEFGRTSIVKILRNKVYIGKVVWNSKKTVKTKDGKTVRKTTDESEWIVCDGLHEPIVSEELFNIVAARLSSRYHKPYNDGTLHNPLAGMIYCSVCGNMMQRRPYLKRKEPEHLLCATKGCQMSSRLDYVEKSVLESLKKELRRLKSLQKKQKPVVDYSAAITAAEKELKKLESQKLKLYDLLEQGIYTTAVFTERSTVIASRIEETEKQLNDLQRKQHKAKTETIETYIKQVETIISLYFVSSPADRNNLLKTAIYRISYTKPKGSAPKDFLLQLTYNWQKHLL